MSYVKCSVYKNVELKVPRDCIQPCEQRDHRLGVRRRIARVRLCQLMLAMFHLKVCTAT